MNLKQPHATSPTDTDRVAPPPVSFWQAFAFWFRLGFISFGGSAGQISIIHQELVERRRWLSERRFLHALNYCMLLPGPEVQQLVTYIGWLMHRTPGGIVAGLLFVLPSFFILVLLGWIYITYGHLSSVNGVLAGIKPAVTAIVMFAAYRIGARTLRNRVLWAIALFSFTAIFVFDAPFPAIILTAALAGAVGGRCAPHIFAGAGVGHGSNVKTFGAAWIDDNTPLPVHTLFSWSRLLRIVVAGFMLWAAVMGFLVRQYGWDGALTQMGWFFTKSAFLTFGGAYAVLPYVYQGAVEHYHWLTAQQMMDALALGETTPGPLIMVVTFVGFVAGWVADLPGIHSQIQAGVIAAMVVTYFTFLPSFLFIFAGGPMVESTHGRLKFTAPLTAITAAVVGVILNQALFFGYHVLWSNGFSGTFDSVSAMIGFCAVVALMRFKVGVIPVIVASGLAGLLFGVLKPLIAQAATSL